MPIKLPSMAVIGLNGPDAVAFAQAQFCNDVPSLADGHWQWNAWLSPQGRVRFFAAHGQRSAADGQKRAAFSCSWGPPENDVSRSKSWRATQNKPANSYIIEIAI